MHFRVLARGNGPYALSLTLVALSVLLDALFDLALIQPCDRCVGQPDTGLQQIADMPMKKIPVRLNDWSDCSAVVSSLQNCGKTS